MNTIPSKISERLSLGIKKFQPKLQEAKNRDFGEADTVNLVREMLCEVFGYDNMREITAEHAVTGGRCDLAIRLNENPKPTLLIEGKAVGVELKEAHVNQVVYYGAKDQVHWVILTNGLIWQIYKVIDTPLNQEKVFEFEFLKLNAKNNSDLEFLYLISKEGLTRRCLEDYDVHQKAMSRFSLAAAILTEPVCKAIRRELVLVSSNAKISIEEIGTVLRNDVLKGEVVDGVKALEAQKKIAKAQRRAAKTSGTSAPSPASSTPVVVTPPQPPSDVSQMPPV